MQDQYGGYRCGRGDINICFRVPVRGLPILVWAWLMLSAVSGISYADQWSMTPSVSVRGQYDDNINMSVDAPVSAWGGTVSPMLDARKSTATSSVNVGGRLIFNRYSDVGNRDTNVQVFTFSGNNRTRLSRFGLTGSYLRDTTIVTTVTQVGGGEGEQDGTDDVGDVDENITQNIVRRGQLRLRPSWTYAMTRLTSMRLSYSLNKTTYGDNAGTSLVDYGRQGIDAALIRRLTQRDRLTVSAGASYYDAPDRGTETTDYDLRAGWGHEFSELLHGEVTLGVITATTTLDNDEVDSAGWSYEARLSQEFSKLTSYQFILGRRLNPSGRGALVFGDYFRANVSRAISPKLSLIIWANAFDNQTLDFFGSSIDRVYYNIEPAFRWKLTRLWSLDGSYRFRWQKFDDQNDAATGNAVYLSINYAWPNIAVSR